MRILYFDCFSGISGDMILAALLDLGIDISDLEKELKKLSLAGYEIKKEKAEKNHITATKIEITLKEKQPHRHLSDIYGIIEKSALDPDIKETSKKIFMSLAKAESKIHDKTIESLHFHEVGAADSILDIVGAAICIKKLEIEKIYSSALHLGKGFSECSHGTIPLPAPATLELLKGIPVYSTGINKELVTPTGAAIITALAASFGEMPAMKIEKIGYGAGKSDLKHPNLLRILKGETKEEYDTDTTDIIETNIDDMSPEYYGHIIEKLLKEGALDAYLTNIHMKNNRPALKLTVVSKKQDTEKLTDIIFCETTTFGVRIRETARKKLFIEKKEIMTKYGKITMKIGKSKNRIMTVSPEYKDCRKIAEKQSIPLKEVYDLARRAYSESQ